MCVSGLVLLGDKILAGLPLLMLLTLVTANDVALADGEMVCGIKWGGSPQLLSTEMLGKPWPLELCGAVP